MLLAYLIEGLLVAVEPEELCLLSGGIVCVSVYAISEKVTEIRIEPEEVYFLAEYPVEYLEAMWNA